MYRYRERGTDELSVVNRRFAGKLYVICPAHGHLGGSATDHATQEFILSKAKIDGGGEKKSPAKPPKKEPAPAPAPVKTPAPAPVKPKDEEPAEEGFWPWE